MVDTLEPPPRLTGISQNDTIALREWCWALYNNFILQGGVVTKPIEIATPQVPAFYGVVGDGFVDDTERFQAAVDDVTAGGTKAGLLVVPPGSYRFTSPILLPPHLRLVSLGGLLGGVNLIADGDFEILGHSGTEDILIDGFTFVPMMPGQGCGIGQMFGTDYLSSTVIQNCLFRAELKECLKGNFILCTVRDSRFGYYGTPGAQHRHIYWEGVVGQSPNRNLVQGNRFYRAKGCRAAVYVGNGNGFTSMHNNYEANNTTQAPIELRGMYPANFIADHIENNTGIYGAIYAGNDNLGAATASYVVSLDACWIQLIGVPTAALGQAGAAGFAINRSAGSLNSCPLYYSEITGLTTGITERGYNQFTNEGGNVLTVRSEVGGTIRQWLDAAQYSQPSGAGSQSADATTLWDGTQSGLSTDAARAVAVSALYYVLNYLTNTGGQVVWKFNALGSTHLEVFATFANNADSSSRTWAVDYTYDLTGATGWTNIISVSHGAGFVSGEGSAPFGIETAMLVRWRQTAGDDANSHTAAVGLQLIAFQTQHRLVPAVFAA